jgi:hypothetical protein
VYRRTVLKLPLLLAAGAALAQSPRASSDPLRASAEPSRWSPDRANSWYQAQGWPVGANFITSNAINQLEMFQPGTYDPRRIDTELGWGRFHGINTVRVFHWVGSTRRRPAFTTPVGCRAPVLNASTTAATPALCKTMSQAF